MPSEVEGVIKYEGNFRERQLPEELVTYLGDLALWRNIFYKKGLIGQRSDRYGGYSYGNLSQLVSLSDGFFAITATQTSDIAPENFDPEKHFAVVTGYDLAENQLDSFGEMPASSEALTHAIPYEELPMVTAVFHSHSPEIWQARKQLDIPTTGETVEYGTPEMAEEARKILRDTDAAQKRIFAMGGHEDGIITFGESLYKAGCLMLYYLQNARYRYSRLNGSNNET